MFGKKRRLELETDLSIANESLKDIQHAAQKCEATLAESVAENIGLVHTIEDLELTIKARDDRILELAELAAQSNALNEELQAEICELQDDLQNEQAAASDVEATIEGLEAEIATLTERLGKFENAFILTGMKDSKSAKIAIDMDWTDEFVDHLASEGVTGQEDITIIKKWLLLVMDQIIDDIEEDEIRINTENSDKGVDLSRE